MATIDTPTSAEPPTDGPVVAAPAPEVNIANQDASNPMPRPAPLEDLAGTVAGATSAGNAWSNEAGKILNSPQGFGLDGYIVTDDPAAADWPTGMMFPHQGPP